MMNLRVVLVVQMLVFVSACGGDKPATTSTTAAEPSGQSVSPPPGSGATGTTEDAVNVASDWFSYHETGDQLIRGFFAFPEDMVEPLPAVLFVHDWNGLDDGMQAAAKRLASAGYMVFAVDFFAGRTAQSTEQAAKFAQGLLERSDDADRNLRDAYRFITEVAGAPRVAAVGWSMGGYWAERAAELFPGEVTAVVNLYGQLQVVDNDAVVDTDALLIIAGNDRAATQELQQQIEQAAADAGREIDVRRFDGVSTGFANVGGPRYSARAAQAAWDEMLGFLARVMPSEAPEA